MIAFLLIRDTQKSITNGFFAPAAEIAKPIENLGETRGRVQELRVKMRALGNVNLDAVDDQCPVGCHGLAKDS